MKKLVSIVVGALCALSMVGCVTPSVPKDLKFDDYSYTNPAVPNKDWRDLTTETGMVIDGIFNETQYNGLTQLAFTGGNTNEYGLSMQSFMGETGIYIKASITDSTLYYNTERPVFQNSSVIFYVSPYVGGVAPTLDTKVIQARVGINGYAEQWIGFKSQDGYDYSRAYVPTMSKVVLKNGDAVVDYTADGDINLITGVTGYDVEIYVPYKSFGLDEKPTNYLIMPEFNKCTAFTSDTARTMYQPAGMIYNQPSTFGGFNASGYMTSGIVSGTTMGSGAVNATLGWDATNDNGTATATTKQLGATDQKIYFKNINGTKYLIEAEVTVNNVLNNDSFPKFGLIAGENKQNTFAFFVDPSKALTNKWVLAVGRNDAQTDWVWPAGMKEFPTMAYTNGAKVKLSVARDGANFYFFVNDEFAGVRSNLRGLGKDDKSFAGFMTMNMASTYTSYSATTDTAAIDAKIGDNKVQEPTKEIDADLSDWTVAEKTKNKRVYGIDTFTAQGFEVYAKYVAGNGLYIAGEAKHKTNPNGQVDWFKNTNFEFFINGNNQNWVISTANSNIQAKMRTTGVAGGFTSTYEVFIPERAIPGLRAEKDYVRLGFAFKVDGENIKIQDRDGGNATDWWWQDKHFPSNGNEQYFIYSDGLYDTAKA